MWNITMITGRTKELAEFLLGISFQALGGSRKNLFWVVCIIRITDQAPESVKSQRTPHRQAFPIGGSVSTYGRPKTFQLTVSSALHASVLFLGWINAVSINHKSKAA